ncbi:carboxynorspermidine decarboxylase [Sporolactobacillus shoreicorticis]|uniref:Carboxynorspermidine decarboxylase n=1 Tax=Sporolactobacillus shoreicorticis TaxID=1923877 RepID=A0ABW5S5J8_9BACL|nr:carboxynorspermidine decarboxylase [Sporolactobacillus shoreicorticis]MCO7127568.1 carboxynorspermidine decarboxylase [Sporolactobacillus shoreicorticis]
MIIDFSAAPSPSYVVDERLLVKNLKILKQLQDRTGCKVLLAQKAFSMYAFYPLIGHYLSGVASSSLYEARLGREEMDKEVHIYSPAYDEKDFVDILKISDHIVFNSFSQWARFKDQVKAAPRRIQCGMRVNPEYSEVETSLYDPCAPFSRMGVTKANFDPDALDGLDGLHFHTLCEQNSDALEHTLEAVERKFGKYLKTMKWINFGGGHHITRAGYDIDRLARCILAIKEKYDVEVYLEPGEAVALNTGYLVSTVLDVFENGMKIAILNTSATCHMPDVLEMPYRPEIIDAGKPGEQAHTYRLGGPTCLAGDVIGDYSFDHPLQVGDRLVFCDMAIYSMVKNNTFNGIALPAIAAYNDEDGIRVIKQFGYENFKTRLS